MYEKMTNLENIEMVKEKVKTSDKKVTY